MSVSGLAEDGRRHQESCSSPRRVRPDLSFVITPLKQVSRKAKASFGCIILNTLPGPALYLQKHFSAFDTNFVRWVA